MTDKPVDALAGTGVGEGGVVNGKPSASYNEIMSKIISARSNGFCSQFDLPEGCTVGQAIGGIIGQRESGHQALLRSVCTEMKNNRETAAQTGERTGMDPVALERNCPAVLAEQTPQPVGPKV